MHLIYRTIHIKKNVFMRLRRNTHAEHQDFNTTVGISSRNMIYVVKQVI